MNGNTWVTVKYDVSNLINVLKKYMDYLEKKNEALKCLHKSMISARSPIQDSICFTLEAHSHILPPLSQFDALLQNLENYRPLLLNDLAGVKSISKQAR